MSNTTFFSIVGAIIFLGVLRRYVVAPWNPYRLSGTYSDAWELLRWPYQKRQFKRHFGLGSANELCIKATHQTFQFLRASPNHRTIFHRGEEATWNMDYFTPDAALNTAHVKQRGILKSKADFEEILDLFPFTEREDKMLCLCKLLKIGMWGEIDTTSETYEHQGIKQYGSIYVVIDDEEGVAYRLDCDKDTATLRCVDLDGETEPALPVLIYHDH